MDAHITEESKANTGYHPLRVRMADLHEAVEAIKQLYTISRFECFTWATAQFSQRKMAVDYIELYQKILKI